MTIERYDTQADSPGRIAASYVLAFACFAAAAWMVFGGLGPIKSNGQAAHAITWHRDHLRPAAFRTEHRPASHHAPPPGVRATAIETITVGQRVLARNPELSDVDRAALGDEPTEATWRKLTLSMRKPTGDAIAITLLRPLDWIDQHDAKPGKTIHLDLPEMGAKGPALVLTIDFSPLIEEGRGRVVTGTFVHTAGNAINVKVRATPEPLGTTSNHPFWSEDRKAFVEAGELKVGETLRLVTGDLTTVEAITERGPPEPVYNLEVHGEHVYYVGTAGVLVHNSYGDGPGTQRWMRQTKKNGEPYAKPGPKPDGPHNDMIDAVIEEQVAAGHTHIGGGIYRETPELVVDTKGGYKESRRPDASFVDKDTGEVFHFNVGRKNKREGTELDNVDPIIREREALEDLRNAGETIFFIPYIP